MPNIFQQKLEITSKHYHINYVVTLPLLSKSKRSRACQISFNKSLKLRRNTTISIFSETITNKKQKVQKMTSVSREADTRNSNCRQVETKKHNTIENETGMETKLYGLRWWIGLFYAAQIILLRMLMNSFGVVNNVYKAYFNISFYAIDWFNGVQYFGKCSSTILLILLIVSEKLGFRKLFILMASCTISSYVFSMLAFSYPHLFWLIYFGQFAAGCAFQASVAIFGTFATAWFPENHVGLAMSMKSMSMCVGCLLACLVPSQLVPPPSSSLVYLENSTLVYASRNVTKIDTPGKDWLDEVRWKYLCLYGGSVFVCCIIWFFAISFVTDEPPKPPTVAQAVIRSQRNKNQSKTWVTFTKCWVECKSMFLSKTVIYATFMLTTVFSSNYVEKVLMGQISRKVFAFRKYGSQINKMAGYLLGLHEAGSFFGSIVAGQLTNHQNRHKAILCTGIALSLALMIGLTIALYFFNVPAVFVCNTLLGFALCLNHIPLFDVVLQDTYPKNTSLVMLVFINTAQIGTVIIGQVCRLILDYTNGTAVLVFLGVFLLASLVACILLQPKFKRHDTSDAKAKEDLPLLNEEK